MRVTQFDNQLFTYWFYVKTTQVTRITEEN
jgi:hypothetical protein